MCIYYIERFTRKSYKKQNEISDYPNIWRSCLNNHKINKHNIKTNYNYYNLILIIFPFNFKRKKNTDVGKATFGSAIDACLCIIFTVNHISFFVKKRGIKNSFVNSSIKALKTIELPFISHKSFFKSILHTNCLLSK